MIKISLQCAGAALVACMFAPAATMAQAPTKPEYISIVQEIEVSKPTDVVWKKVGGYCDLSAWLGASCVYTSGAGGLGTNRLIANRINEVMVAKTSTSYTYAQPLAPNSYHGTVEILPVPTGSKIIYTLFYDVSMLPDQAAKDRDRATRAKLFMGALQKMKSIAETP